jgi:hypothetical protein
MNKFTGSFLTELGEMKNLKHLWVLELFHSWRAQIDWWILGVLVWITCRDLSPKNWLILKICMWSFILYGSPLYSVALLLLFFSNLGELEIFNDTRKQGRLLMSETRKVYCPKCTGDQEMLDYPAKDKKSTWSVTSVSHRHTFNFLTLHFHTAMFYKYHICYVCMGDIILLRWRIFEFVNLTVRTGVWIRKRNCKWVYLSD